MKSVKGTGSTARFTYLLATATLFAVALFFLAPLSGSSVRAKTNSDTGSVAPSAVFAADAPSLGAVADGPAACDAPGPARNVTFTVAGITGPLSDVRANFTMSPAHTWVGDLDVTLISPGGTAQKFIFTAVGGGGAEDSNLAGPYTFHNGAPAAPTFWTAAALPSASTIPSGEYRASDAVGVNTDLLASFVGLSTAQINGTWTLRFEDFCAGDTGTVSAANLTLSGGAVVASDAPVDFNGDGRTDYTVVRNVGGGTSGQVRWFYNLNNSANPTVAFDWGIASDFFISEDFDGDDKDDIAVWRPGAATVAAFYIFNSATSTVRVEAFGQTGDDPKVVDDYDGDNKADLAVYRAGAAAGDPSTWYYRTTANGPVTYVPWGQNGDFPAPGDYDGDGKADFVIQRNNGGGQARFWTRLATGATSTTVFGTPTDVIVPGDWDGDGKTDIATVRGVGGAIQWQYLSSLNASINYITFGASATDSVTQGDYDGDGKTDAAIWRPSVTPGVSAFWTRSTGSGAVVSYPYAQNGDYPVANFNTH
jgi:subtilisin-like proprotein convertase family protein